VGVSNTPIISETGKAKNFKFCVHIHGINRKKSLLKTAGKVAVGIFRDSENFQGTRILGASCGHLCYSLDCSNSGKSRLQYCITVDFSATVIKRDSNSVIIFGYWCQCG